MKCIIFVVVGAHVMFHVDIFVSGNEYLI